MPLKTYIVKFLLGRSVRVRAWNAAGAKFLACRKCHLSLNMVVDVLCVG